MNSTQIAQATEALLILWQDGKITDQEYFEKSQALSRKAIRAEEG